MPRQCTEKYKESTTYRYCSYCKANRDKRRFDKHQAACKIIWQLQHRHQKLQSSSKPINKQTEGEEIDNSVIKVNFRLPSYTTVVTRNNLKGGDGPQVDGDISIPDSFEEEMAMEVCKTAEQCNCLFLIY
jgi:hypothetical protein